MERNIHARRMVEPEWQERLLRLISFENLTEKEKESGAELTYRCVDGRWRHLKVTVLQNQGGENPETNPETLWIFTEIDPPSGEQSQTLLESTEQ